MTREQISLIQHSATAHFDSRKVALHFYGRLFALDSSLRLLFPPDTNELATIAAVLTFIIREAGKPEGVFPHIAKLGETYGNRSKGSGQYAAVGEALLWALEKELGSELTAEVREAWEAMYATSATMIVAMSRPAMAA